VLLISRAVLSRRPATGWLPVRGMTTFALCPDASLVNWTVVVAPVVGTVGAAETAAARNATEAAMTDFILIVWLVGWIKLMKSLK